MVASDTHNLMQFLLQHHAAAWAYATSTGDLNSMAWGLLRAAVTSPVLHPDKGITWLFTTTL
jgi:hypothetical protein